MGVQPLKRDWVGRWLAKKCPSDPIIRSRKWSYDSKMLWAVDLEVCTVECTLNLMAEVILAIVSKDIAGTLLCDGDGTGNEGCHLIVVNGNYIISFIKKKYQQERIVKVQRYRMRSLHFLHCVDWRTIRCLPIKSSHRDWSCFDSCETTNRMEAWTWQNKK